METSNVSLLKLFGALGANPNQAYSLFDARGEKIKKMLAPALQFEKIFPRQNVMQFFTCVQAQKPSMLDISGVQAQEPSMLDISDDVLVSSSSSHLALSSTLDVLDDDEL